MKVLWFSNVNLTVECKGSGSWLYSMSDSLVDIPNFELINITQDSSYKEIKRIELRNNFIQYVLPIYKLNNGVPSIFNIKKIQKIVDSERPDLIHVWGTESYWGLLTARKYIKGNVLLEMQGILSTCYRAYYANLTPSQILKTISLKETLKPSVSLPYKKFKLKQKLILESEIIESHNNISVQSDWVKYYIKLVAPSANIFTSLISVRDEFILSSWSKETNLKIPVLATTISAVPYKGMLDVVLALSYLKKMFPNILLYVIGYFRNSLATLRISGYERLVVKTIKKLHLEKNIIFCGALNSAEIVDVFSKSDVFIQPSYVESYSLALAEAMAYGIPCVSSYAGALSSLGENDKNISFYSPGDIFMCASKISELLRDPLKQKKYSLNSIETAKTRNDATLASNRQIEIYNTIFKNNYGSSNNS